mmetsp:Transcript_4193/g.8728  ORF Transcript_4193/g.8728 Transcript_4193/m.8728 type:complete len:664 (-) Transcript_4193:2483-4474(-)|eukprot:CAMPEP_0168748284 /NCGR_PEP_ID=MMETSP0724-20121128/16096_1 /TAXON_ID=265536 /ORGANISM="Amphiprora sp., Strain CCMP467" /LENGTH=663 /DNA_ID=CAMNT_0008796107 /DNA_START=17 /DNA_END=2008 /DNA_ORIENTATION=-
MVLFQWMERGLGQMVAPDKNYEAQPEHMDTRSNFWTITAPDPQFTEGQSVNRPPLHAFKNMESIESTTTTEENDSDAPKTVFLSPTPAKRKKRPTGEAHKENISETQSQILLASRDTFDMQHLNSKYRDQALKLLQYCSSTSKLKEKALANIEKLLKMDAERTKTTNGSEPSLLCCRSYKMGVSCPDGYTPLLATAMSNQMAAAKILLRYAKDQQELLRHTNLFGQTAQHIAAHHGQAEMLEFLEPLMSGEASFQSSPSPQIHLLEGPAPIEDVSGLTAYGAGMISPAPKAKKNRERLAKFLSPAVPLSQRKRKEIHSLRHLRLKYATAHLNGRRVLNEDAIMCKPLSFCNGMLFVVCDGHGDRGSVAGFIAQELPGALERVHDPATKKQEEAYWTQLCQGAALEMDEKLKTAHVDGGSTAVWVIVTDGLLVVSNVGDSRCILIHKEGVMALSEDHKPELPEEKSRIEEAGLEVIHETYTEKQEGEEEDRIISISKVQLSEVNQLGVSRAFGDFEYKKSDKTEAPDAQAVIAIPDVNCVQRVPDRDEYLVLACDGVWDVQSNEAVAQFIKTKNGENNNDLAATGEKLLQECLHSDDNLSVIIIAFQLHRPGKPSASLVDTSLTPEIAKLNLNAGDDEDGVKVESPDLIGAKALNFASPEKASN